MSPSSTAQLRQTSGRTSSRQASLGEDMTLLRKVRISLWKSHHKAQHEALDLIKQNQITAPVGISPLHFTLCLVDAYAMLRVCQECDCPQSLANLRQALISKRVLTAVYNAQKDKLAQWTKYALDAALEYARTVGPQIVFMSSDELLNIAHGIAARAAFETADANAYAARLKNYTGTPISSMTLVEAMLFVEGQAQFGPDDVLRDMAQEIRNAAQLLKIDLKAHPPGINKIFALPVVSDISVPWAQPQAEAPLQALLQEAQKKPEGAAPRTTPSRVAQRWAHSLN